MLQVAAGEQGCAAVKGWQKDELGSLRREILGAVVHGISGAAMKTEGDSGAVNVELDAGPSSNLPFTKPLYMLPFQPRSGSDADSVVADISLPAARAGLQLFLLVSAAQCTYGTVGDASTDALSLADAWVFVSRSLISSDAIWQDETVMAVTDSICDQLVHIEQTGSGVLRLQDATRFRFGLEERHYGSTMSDLLEKLLLTYGEESFGVATLGRCVSLFLRDDQPMEMRRQIWRYCATNGGGLLELLDPICWRKVTVAGAATASAVAQVVRPVEPSSAAERYEIARAQHEALLTPMATNIASSGRPEPPLFDLAATGVADFLRGVGLGRSPQETDTNKGKDSREEDTHLDDDDAMGWERKQLLSDLFSAATEAAGRRTALHSLVSRLGLDHTTQALCLDDLDKLEEAFGIV